MQKFHKLSKSKDWQRWVFFHDTWFNLNVIWYKEIELKSQMEMICLWHVGITVTCVPWIPIVM